MRYGCYQKLSDVSVGIIQTPAGRFKAYYIYDSATMIGVARGGRNIRMIPVSSKKFLTAEACYHWLLFSFGTKNNCLALCPRKTGAVFTQIGRAHV